MRYSFVLSLSLARRVQSGKVQVEKAGKILATLSEGCVFGEMSALGRFETSAAVTGMQCTRCGVLVHKSKRYRRGSILTPSMASNSQLRRTCVAI